FCTLFMLGQVARSRKDFERAQACYEASVILWREVPTSATFMVHCLHGLGGLAQAQGQPQRAARLFGAFERLLPSAFTQSNLPLATREELDREVAAVGAQRSP